MGLVNFTSEGVIVGAGGPEISVASACRPAYYGALNGVKVVAISHGVSVFIVGSLKSAPATTLEAAGI